MPRLFENDHKSPRWIWLPSLVGSLGVLVLRAVPVPDSALTAQAWVMAIVPLVAMAFLARSWRGRLPVTAHELEYVRVGIAVLTIFGLGALNGGAWPVTLIAGPAFWIWTVVENRRAPPRGGR